MGDVVKSRQSDQKELYKKFNLVVKKVSKKHSRRIISPLTITLGDEFQGITTSTLDAFRIATSIGLEAMSANFRCRHVIAAGRIDTRINRKKSWNMLGEGLTVARETLNDKTKNDNRYRFVVSGPIATKSLNFIGQVMTSIEDGWTARQLEVVTTVLKSRSTNMETAEALGIADRVFYKILKSASFQMYQGCFITIEQILTEFDKSKGLAHA